MRAIICPDKVNTEEWLFAHRTAHEVGLRSNVTIMHGSVERPVHVARHLVRTRDLQKETGGFTEFVPLPFVHMATPIFIQGKARRGPTFREVLLMHAVGRIAYRDTIPNVQASWVKCGISGTRQILQAGANDLGGTLMDENISRAAGASHGQELDEAEFRSIVEPIGRTLAQRTTLYGRTQTVGRRLRPVEEHPTHAGDAQPVVAHHRSEEVSRFDVLTLGNALVDVLAHADDDFVARTGVEPGAMTMIDAARSDEIYAEMGPPTEISGGSAANTAAGVASFGGKAAYIGRVADDAFGKVFAHDLRSVGVHFDAPLATNGPPTGPLPRHRHPRRRPHAVHVPRRGRRARRELHRRDAGRERGGHLPRGLHLGPARGQGGRAPRGLDRAPLRPPRRAHALRSVLRRAPPRGVRRPHRERHRHPVRERGRDHVALPGRRRSTRRCTTCAGHCEIAALTRGPHGSVIVAGDDVHVIDAHPATVVDTTGAGDLFAAGFLYGLTHGHDLATCGQLASLGAAEVISHLGARPAVPLAELARPMLGA